VHLALRVDEGGVTALADREALHIVGDLAVEKFHAIRAHQAKAAAVAEVEDAHGVAEGAEFCHGVTIAGDDFRAVNGEEGRAECGVEFVQGQNRHEGRIAGAWLIESEAATASPPARARATS
jgi:hypothetical protein